MNKKSISSLEIHRWLNDATVQLYNAGVPSARLDAEIILAHTLRRPRTYLHAHGDATIEPRQREIADARLHLRLEFTPIAYIIGHKEFYGRQFKVTTATLIPRPESETMIDLLKTTIGHNTSLMPRYKHLVDVGTGTGCLGITAKLELPELEVTLSDISRHALNIAAQNAAFLKADVEVHQGDLLHGYGGAIDIILANLPYVDRKWEVSRETHAEPPLALFAGKEGLSLILTLIVQAGTLLHPGGLLILESDPRQHTAIADAARKYGLKHVQTVGFISCFKKLAS